MSPDAADRRDLSGSRAREPLVRAWPPLLPSVRARLHPRNRGCPELGGTEGVDLAKGQWHGSSLVSVRAPGDFARVGTTIAAATVFIAIRVAAEPASNPTVRSGTKDSTVRAAAVRTNVARGRRAVRAMMAAMPTPTSEKTSVSCEPGDRDARTCAVGERDAGGRRDRREDGGGDRGDDGGGDSLLPDRLSLGRRGRRGEGRAGGDLRGGGHVELRFLGGAPGATRSCPSTNGRGTDPTGREKKCPSVPGDAPPRRFGRESRP